MPPEPTPDPATGPADANTEARRSLRDRTSFTRLLSRVAAGDRSDLDRLLEVVYEELRRLAQVHLRGERADHTLAATALVHEAYVRLVDQREVAWQDRAHFFAAASRIIRRILVDHARARHALKRGGRRAGDAGRIELDALESPEDGIDVIELEDALTRLAEIDERQARIVELRYFGGLTIDQIAEVLDLGARTVDRDWRCARTWLYEALRPGDDDPHEERSARRRGDDV
ncbi:MAG TPA: sigma-70 family RNA polymerase sigma factor [Phycisphaerales bacterium]|nr:sigma-70 family RNA polymerase sigma factor [Phycisphaerales bacterium]